LQALFISAIPLSIIRTTVAIAIEELPAIIPTRSRGRATNPSG
jgi:hypothetical protein